MSEHYKLVYIKIERNNDSGTQNLRHMDPLPEIGKAKIAGPKFFTTRSRSIGDKFENYLSEKPADDSIEVGEFYKSIKKAFPYLYGMVKDFMSAPEISAPSVVLV